MNEKKEVHQRYNITERLTTTKREPELEGNFECQPEYRKAYIDYLVREKKPPIIPRKRLAEMLDNLENTEITPSEEIR